MEKKNNLSMKPKLFVLSPDMTTNQLVARTQRLSRACDLCKKRKTKCQGGNPCQSCRKANIQCIYREIASHDKSHDLILGSPNKIKKRSGPLLAVKVKKSLKVNNGDNIHSANYQQDVPKLSQSKPKHNLNGNESAEIESFSPESVSTSPERYYSQSKSQIDNSLYQDIVKAIFPPLQLDKILNSPSFDRESFINIISSHISNSSLNINSVINTYIPSRARVPLPPKDVALKLIMKTWDCVCILFRFYHRPTIVKLLESLYEDNDSQNKTYNNEQLKVLPLIYSVLAVGALFCKDDVNGKDVSTREFYEDEGQKFFLEAKRLIDIANADDIYSIQTIFMMTLFLQCTAKIKICYSYVGIAMRALVKNGFHRTTSLIGPTPIIDETRKRLFWSVFKVDMYLNCIMGIPFGLSDSDVNQDLPADVEDENIREDGIIYKKCQFGLSSAGANNQHTKLILIMSHICKALRNLHHSNYSLSAVEEKVKYFENELFGWYASLPNVLRADDDQLIKTRCGERCLKAKKLLYLDYLLTKLLLYKPFSHYIIMHPSQYPTVSFHFGNAIKCFETAHAIIKLAEEMIKEGFLNGSYWFSVHTIFYSVSCLEFFSFQYNKGNISGNPLSFSVQETSKIGMEILLHLRQGSDASNTTFNVLKPLFEELNQRTSEASTRTLLQMKSHIATFQDRESDYQDGRNEFNHRTNNLTTTPLYHEWQDSKTNSTEKQGGPANNMTGFYGMTSRRTSNNIERGQGSHHLLSLDGTPSSRNVTEQFTVSADNNYPYEENYYDASTSLLKPEDFFRKFLDDYANESSKSANIDIKSLLSSSNHDENVNSMTAQF